MWSRESPVPSKDSSVGILRLGFIAVISSWTARGDAPISSWFGGWLAILCSMLAIFSRKSDRERYERLWHKRDWWERISLELDKDVSKCRSITGSLCLVEMWGYELRWCEVSGLRQDNSFRFVSSTRCLLFWGVLVLLFCDAVLKGQGLVNER